MNMQSKTVETGALQGSYTCFTVGGEEFGIMTHQVTGVQEAPVVRRVPKAPGFIKGVANVRGRILTVIDTCNRFEATQTEQMQKTMLLAELEGVLFGLLAEDVTGITYLGKEMIEPVNPVLVSKEMPFISAMAMVEQRLVHLLDLDALIYAGVHVDKKDKTAYASYAQNAQKTLRHIKQTVLKRHLIMQIGQETYGLPIEALKEIKTGTSLDKLAAGPDYLSGVIKTVQGMIPVLDMQKKYDLEPVPYGPQSRIVMLETGRGSFGIMANTASEMIGIASEEIKETPKAIAGEQTKHIHSVAMLDKGKRLVAILDPENVVTTTDFNALSKVEGVEITRHHKKGKPAGGKTVKPFLTFQVAGHEFAFDMADLVEVIPYKPVSRIPKAPAHVRGLIPVKGALVTVTDLRTALDIKTDGKPDEKHIIIVRIGDVLHGIIADRVSEIMQVAEQDLIKPGDFLKGIKLDAIEKVIRVRDSDRVPMVLNLDKAIS